MKVMFVATHPDDETLGCGGTILKHKNGGDEIYWLIITNISEADGWDYTQVDERQLEIKEVTRIYGFSSTQSLNFPTMKLDTIPMGTIVKRISEVISKIQPETIYIPNYCDVHTDHQVVFKAMMSCTKNFRYPFIKKLLMYECLSETEFAPPETAFLPNVFVDITPFMDKKIRIMQKYKGEMSPLPRSEGVIRALATYRGSRMGVKYAEAFQLLFNRIS